MHSIKNLLAKASKKDNQLNILTHPTHEGYETNLAQTGHTFWAYQNEGIKDWKECYRPLPANYILLRHGQLPDHVNFDLILLQNIAHWKYFKPIQQKYHLPMIRLEHCFNTFHPSQQQQLKQLQGDINIFISNISRKQWGFSESEGEVITHGVDDSFFFANSNINRKLNILSVANDFANRGHLLGFNIWQEVTRDLRKTIVGDTRGLSEAARSIFHLREFYQSHEIFLNTSLISPIPSVMLEAAACECAIISTNNSLIPEIFTHEKDALLSNDPKELRKFAEHLQTKPEECRKLGKAARQTMLEKCNLQQFLDKWNVAFQKANKLIYIGE